MEPTGSTANFSWNHLSGLANLSRLLGLSPWFLALCCLPLPPRYIHKAWRYQEVTVGTEGYFVPSWFEEHWVDSTCVIHLDIVWPLTTAQVQPSIPYNDLYHSVFNGNGDILHVNFKPCEEKKMQSLISGISWCQIWWYNIFPIFNVDMRISISRWQSFKSFRRGCCQQDWLCVMMVCQLDMLKLNKHHCWLFIVSQIRRSFPFVVFLNINLIESWETGIYNLKMSWSHEVSIYTINILLSSGWNAVIIFAEASRMEFKRQVVAKSGMLNVTVKFILYDFKHSHDETTAVSKWNIRVTEVDQNCQTLWASWM